MALYAATIFFGAFLLFLVQPIIARQILPWFGGAASVWATCLVFFQSMLLLGYAYADWTSRRCTPRTQALLHTVLLAASLALLPIVPDATWKPSADSTTGPALIILGLLSTTIGLQYFLLSSTSPLIQSWYWRRFRSHAPYRLFALSNFASLLALLAYPVLVEPYLRLTTQSRSWSVIYGVFAVLCAATAWFSSRAAERVDVEPEEPVAAPPTRGTRLLWLALSAGGSCLLLAVTNHLTQNIASIPFLWVVPLALYLVTFILCFDHPRWYVRPAFLAVAIVLLPVMAGYSDSLNLWVAAPLYAAGLFVGCMFCHGELYRLRPAPAHLTTFYLMIAAGGAVGALLIGFGAPLVLNGYYELVATLVVLALLVTARLRDSGRWMVAAGLASVVVTTALATLSVRDYLDGARVAMRNFYGVVRTRDYPNPVPYRALFHGAIDHGGQMLDDSARDLPTSYFGPTSGYGRVLRVLADRPGPRRFGVIGLGAGVIAVYTRAGDTLRFYEIDPQVAALAAMEFSFLRDTRAHVDVVLGDGRLTLEREPAQRFDFLAIDAFSGDAIPMHLLTREAMATYVRHLADDGVLVFQATNRYVDIAPVVQRLATEFGLVMRRVVDDPEYVGSKGHEYWLSSTEHLILTRRPELFESPRLRDVAQALPQRAGFPVWTDDFYNLLRILH